MLAILLLAAALRAPSVAERRPFEHLASDPALARANRDGKVATIDFSPDPRA